MKEQPILETKDLSKIYRLDGVEVHAVESVSLSIRRGEFVSIMGPSGSGKSTLMHLIGCLDRPTSGYIAIEGEEVGELGDNQLARVRSEKVGFVFQTFNLLARASALKNVEMPLIYAGVGLAERRERAKKALEEVGLADRLYHRPNQLSGGQQQRVAVARALVTNPSIILADEPTGNLDSKSGAEIMNILQELHSQGKTIVLVTHEKYVAEHAQRIIRILDGRVVGDKKVANRRNSESSSLEEWK